PYDFAPDEIAARLAAHQLELVLINAPPGGGGERGIASLPGREADFDASIGSALAYAGPLGVRRVHVMAGVLPTGADRRRYLDTYVANLVRAADRFADANVTVMIEPINTRVDVPGYLLDSTALALECIARTARA